jgi:guanosine-3',5'-bis(diphosphate) 3'-pyrophosphohydrolase
MRRPKKTSDLALILDALSFAAHKHRDQRRKDPRASPYINHPIALAGVLMNEGRVRDPKVICAALLHDTVEDTETTPEELEARFGRAIRDIVLEVTDDKNLPKAERKRLQVVHAGGLSRRAKLVKLADKICNLRDIADSPPADWDLRRQREYYDWAKRVIDRLRGVHPRLEAAFDAAYARRPRGR